MKKLTTLLIYFTLLVPPVIFFTDLTRNPYYVQIVLLNCSILLIWVLYLLSGSQKDTITLKSSPFDKQIFLFLLVATASWLVTLVGTLDHPYMKFSVYSEGSKRWISLFVNSLLAYYLAVNFIDDKNRNRYINAAFLAGFVASAYGVMQYFGMEPIWPKLLTPFGGRSVSSFGNPNFLSSYLVLLLPLAFVRFITSTEGAGRFAYGVLMMTLFTSLLCTLTRSSWAGAFCGMCLLLLFIWIYERKFLLGKKKLILTALILFGLFVFALPKSKVGGENPNVFERLSEVKTAKTTYYAAYEQRLLIWSCAWHMVKENPFIGKGWGCFELFYPFYQGRHLFLPEYRAFRTHANNSHNEILEIWSQTGTVGFGVYLWLIVSIITFFLFVMKNTEDSEKRLLSIALFSSLVGMWIDNLLNVSIHFAVPQFLYWWNLGLLANIGYRKEVYVSLKTPARKAVIYFLIIWGAFLIVRYYRCFMGEIHYFEGFKLSKQNDIVRAIPELEEAHSYQRLEVNNNYELANAYARAGMRDKAIWGYMESLKANAGYDEIYFNLATVISQMGHFDEGITEYTRSLFINPLSQEAYNALGSIFMREPNVYSKAALDMYEQNVKVYPENKDAWNNIGYIYTQSNRYQEALAAYKKALELDPDFDVARRNFKAVLAKANIKDDFLAKTDALFSAIDGRIQKQDWDGALNKCNELLKLIPNSYKAKLYEGNIYFSQKNFDKAIAVYTEILLVRPDSNPVKTNLAMAYSETGKFDLAKTKINEVLAADPNNPGAKQALAVITQREAKH